MFVCFFFRKECFWSKRSITRTQYAVLNFLTHTVLGHWLPSWIPFSHLMKLRNFQAATLCTATKRYPSFLTEGIQDGRKVLMMEHIIHLFAKLDESFQISMCFSSERRQRKRAYWVSSRLAFSPTRTFSDQARPSERYFRQQCTIRHD